MSKYVVEAQERGKRIKYLYDNSGAYGYSEAKRLFDKISDSYSRASRNKSNSDDALMIRDIVRQCEKIINMMQQLSASASDKIDSK